MITGHFGLAAGAKAADPRTPLWSLMLAAVWLDVVFIPLLLLGWNGSRLRRVAGTADP